MPYTVDQLYAKLERADAAGDTEAAKVIADEIRKQQAPQTDFSAVTSTSTTKPRAISPASRATDGMSGVDRFRAGLGKAFADTGRGLRQAGTDAARHFVEAGLGMKAPGLRASLARQQSAIDESARMDADLVNTGAGLAGNIGGQLAMMAVPGKAITSIPRAAAAGGVFSATQPVTSGNTRAGQAASGALWGAAGQGVTAVTGRVAKGASDKLSQQAVEMFRRAQAAGIPVHLSQLTDSKAVKTLASSLSYLPFSGAGAKSQQQQQAFNRAVGRGFGADEPVLDDVVMAAAKKRIGAEFDDIYNRNPVTLDDEALSQLARIEQTAARNLPPDEARIVKNQIDDLMAMGDNGVMPGLAYQSFRTDRLLPMEAGQRSFLTNSVRDVRKALDEAANRSVGPADAARLSRVRGQYRNYKTADKALSQVEGAKGNVRPASLWPIVNQARGASTEMRELARVGQFLKDPIPDSGTAGRLAAYAVLGGAGGAGAMSGNENLSTLSQLVLAGATAGRLVNSSALPKYLVQGGGRPLRGLARAARPLPLLVPAVASSAEKKNPPKAPVRKPAPKKSGD